MRQLQVAQTTLDLLETAARTQSNIDGLTNVPVDISTTSESIARYHGKKLKQSYKKK